MFRSQKKQFKREIIKLVKREAYAFMETGQIASKEEFKKICRKLTHKILEKEHENVVIEDATPRKVAKYVQKHINARTQYYEQEGQRADDSDN